ncbi:hypothetical protein ACHAXS_000441 [Conticribra weissflogii]
MSGKMISFLVIKRESRLSLTKLSSCRPRACDAEPNITNGVAMESYSFASSSFSTISLKPPSANSKPPSSVSSLFSASTATSPTKPKKSIHSKLLRVLSPLNTNASFACIEAELLRVDLDKSMAKCVSDWIQKRRWDDLIELESNFRMYLDKNMPFIELDHCTENRESGLSFHDQMRLKYFPYEHIIKSIIADAIKLNSTQKETREIISSDGKVDGGIFNMSRANEFLESMSTFKVSSGNPHWTIHHSSCSNCYRFAISGWLVLWRRERDSVSETVTSTMLNHATLHPGDETFKLVRKWMHFCRFDDKKYEGMGEVANGAIKSTDIPLLRGVIKMLALSEHEEHKRQSALLNIDVKKFFPE